MSVIIALRPLGRKAASGLTRATTVGHNFRVGGRSSWVGAACSPVRPGSSITSSRTRAIASRISSARAAACDRSMISERSNGPRSLMRTMTGPAMIEPVAVMRETRTRVPNGRLRWAAVSAPGR